MNAKEYLQQAYRLNELIDSNQRELDQLRALSTSISAVDVSKERVQGGADSHDKIGSIIAKIVDLNDIINDEIDRFVDLKTDIHNKIMLIPDNTETSVYKGYKQDKIEMRGDRAEMSDFPLYLNTVAGGLDRRDQTIGGFSFVVKIYAVPVVEIIG